MKTIACVIELIEKHHDGIISRLSEKTKVHNRPYSRNAIEKYCAIKKEFDAWDGQFDSDFCADFMDFYQVRLNRAKKEKSDLFCKTYFEVFKEMKDKNETDFSTVIEVMQKRLSGITSGVQTSFVSKLIHTINNDAAIYDSYVKKVLGLWDSGCLPQIQQFIDENRGSLEPLVDDIISRVVGISDAAIVGGVTISYTKKCDFVLWQLGYHLKSKNK